jgi:alpha-tubulin suppressor-like RCC1 family protein
MFSLIITILAIALVVILILATLYFGGSAFGRGAAKVSAETLMNQAAQIAAAADVAMAQGTMLLSGLKVVLPPELLKSMPVPPASAYAKGTAPAADDWEYYIPGQLSHFGLKLKVKKDVCMEVNMSQGFVGIPAAWDGVSRVQCFGPGVDGGYTYLYEPPRHTPAQHDAALQKSIDDAKTAVPTVRAGYPRECPDGTHIETGVCGGEATVPTGPEGFWVIKGVVDPEIGSLNSEGFSTTCPPGAINPASSAATPVPSTANEPFNADGLIYMTWDFDAVETIERTWCIPANAADVPDVVNLSPGIVYGGVVVTSSKATPATMQYDPNYGGAMQGDLTQVTANNVTWSLMAMSFGTTTLQLESDTIVSMHGAKLAIGKTSMVATSYYVNAPAVETEDALYENFAGTLTFDPPIPACSASRMTAPLGTGGRVVQVLVDMYYTAAILKEDGSVWMAGNGSLGEFGDCTEDGSYFWKRVATDVVDIGRGEGQFYLVKRDGSLWSSGQFRYFAAGPNYPADLDTLKFVRLVDSGVVHAESGSATNTTYLKSDGTLWYVGFNTNYQAGAGEGTKNINTPYQVDSNVATFESRGPGLMYVKRDASLWMTGALNDTHLAASYPLGPYGNNVKTTPGGRPLKIADGVAQGTRFNGALVYLKTDGTVWAGGKDPTGCGIFGRGTTTAAKNLTSWTQLAPTAGPFAKISWSEDTMNLLAQNGQVYAAGCNRNGTMGTGNTTAKSTFTAIASGVAQLDGNVTQYLLRTDGSLWAAGRNLEGEYGIGERNDGSLVFVPSQY